MPPAKRARPDDAYQDVLAPDPDAATGLPVLDAVRNRYEDGAVYFLRRYTAEGRLLKKTYKGFTPNLRQRLRDHNGVHEQGSARAGAVYTHCDNTRFVNRFELVVRGFQSRPADASRYSQALSFEYWIKGSRYAKHWRKRLRAQMLAEAEARARARGEGFTRLDRARESRRVAAAARKADANATWKSKLLHARAAALPPSFRQIAQCLNDARWGHLEVLWFAPQHRPLLKGRGPGALFGAGVREYIVSDKAKQDLFRKRPRERLDWPLPPY